MNSEQRCGKFDFLTQFNREYAAKRSQSAADGEPDASVQAYELAFHRQAGAPEVVDLSQETTDTQSHYGINHATALSLLRVDHGELADLHKGRTELNDSIVDRKLFE